MPWFKLKNNDYDPCDPDSYQTIQDTPECDDGPYLYAIFADRIENDSRQIPDIEGTPGLLLYMVRALARARSQPSETFPPVPIEVKMTSTPTKN